MIRLIIFDWDDVFTLGSKEVYFRCYHETLLELGVHLEPEEEKRRIMANWGRPHREVVRDLTWEKPALLEKAWQICDHKIFGETFASSLRMVTGAVELLKRLSGKYILCVATGLHSKILQEKVMPRFDVPMVFSQIISSYDFDDADKQKPNPFMAKEILRTQKIAPDEAVLVGDAQGDVRMARAAGVTPVVVLTGHLNRQEAEALKVPYIIDDVTKLESVLVGL